MLPVLVLKDGPHHSLFAHLVPHSPAAAHGKQQAVAFFTGAGGSALYADGLMRVAAELD